VEHSTGENPIEIEIDSVINPAGFARRHGQIYSRWQPSRMVTLISEVEGDILAVDDSVIRKLPSYKSSRLKAVGVRQKVTDGLGSAAGTVFLSHPSQAQVDADTEIIRQIESRVYTLKP